MIFMRKWYLNFELEISIKIKKLGWFNIYWISGFSNSRRRIKNNTLKTTFDFNFDFNQDFKEHRYTIGNREKLSINSFSLLTCKFLI